MGTRITVAALAALALAASTAPDAWAASKPQRVMSMNGCTDLLVLQLIPKSRVVSVTYRAKDAARGVLPGVADGVPVTVRRPESKERTP